MSTEGKTPTAFKAGYNIQLDGLRGFAILTVLLHHFGMHLPSWLDWGPLGVRLFFVLSGFFITLSVWKIKDSSRGLGNLGVQLGAFHGNRLLRLTPVLYISLALGFLWGFPEIREALGRHMLFLTNFYIVEVGYWPHVVSHLWSLSVQEQFYLVWPFLLLLTPRAWFPAVLAAVVCMAVSFRAACLLMDYPEVFRWVMLPGCLDSFAAGALVAWWKHEKPAMLKLSSRSFWTFGGIAVGGYLVARQMRYVYDLGWWAAFIEVLEMGLLVWLVLGASRGWSGPVKTVIEWKPLVWFGKVSLGIYIYHVLVHIAFGPWLDAAGLTGKFAGGLPRFCVLLALTAGVAWLSWMYVESPIEMVRKRLKAAARRTVPQPLPEVKAPIRSDSVEPMG